MTTATRPMMERTTRRQGRQTLGVLRFNLHPGQRRMMASARRFVAVIAGTQSGKTVSGPPWLLREMQRKGPGTHLVATPTYPLLGLKALPEFLRLFQTTLGLGTYVGQPTKRFVLSPAGETFLWGEPQREPTQVVFGHAGDPDSLESATVKGAWLDEAGQKGFRLGSWEAIQRRLSVHEGRALITTTPYNLGWLKAEVYDRWKAGDPTYDVIRFDSTENPAFPRAEFARAKATLPRWRFDMFYRGVWARPAGLIYDCFDPEAHRQPHFDPPADWPRYVGVDFGGVNTAAVYLAEEPGTGVLHAYREYHAGSRTAAEHATALLAGEPGLPAACVGGARSEGQWRAEFAKAGLPVRPPPVWEVEVGINRVYAAVKEGKLRVSERCPHLLDEFATYARDTDDAGTPLETIAGKETYHRLDALRYVVSWARRAGHGSPWRLESF